MVANVFSRVLSWLVSFVIGVAFGVAATVGHASLPPVGLVVGAVGCAAILVALRMLADDRGAVLAAGVGMYAALLVISQRGPGGSVIVPASTLATVWMVVLGAIILLAVVTPDFRKLRAAQTARDRQAAASPVAPASGALWADDGDAGTPRR